MGQIGFSEIVVLAISAGLSALKLVIIGAVVYFAVRLALRSRRT